MSSFNSPIIDDWIFIANDRNFPVSKKMILWNIDDACAGKGCRGIALFWISQMKKSGQQLEQLEELEAEIRRYLK